MTVSHQPAVSLLDSVLEAESTHVNFSITVLKKAQDLTEQQGAAMVKLLEQAAVTPDLPRLDVCA